MVCNKTTIIVSPNGRSYLANTTIEMVLVVDLHVIYEQVWIFKICFVFKKGMWGRGGSTVVIYEWALVVEFIIIEGWSMNDNWNSLLIFFQWLAIVYQWVFEWSHEWLLSSNMIGLGVMVFSVVLFVALHTIFLFEFSFELDVLRLIIMFPLLYILLCFETNCIWSWVAN